MKVSSTLAKMFRKLIPARKPILEPEVAVGDHVSWGESTVSTGVVEAIELDDSGFADAAIRTDLYGEIIRLPADGRYDIHLSVMPLSALQLPRSLRPSDPERRYLDRTQPVIPLASIGAPLLELGE
jgi:hypothetical protein